MRIKSKLEWKSQSLDAVYTFFKSLNMGELEDVLEEMKRCLKR